MNFLGADRTGSDKLNRVSVSSSTAPNGRGNFESNRGIHDA